jgi:hypothetical protein
VVGLDDIVHVSGDKGSIAGSQKLLGRCGLGFTLNSRQAALAEAVSGCRVMVASF